MTFSNLYLRIHVKYWKMLKARVTHSTVITVNIPRCKLEIVMRVGRVLSYLAMFRRNFRFIMNTSFSHLCFIVLRSANRKNSYCAHGRGSEQWGNAAYIRKKNFVVYTRSEFRSNLSYAYNILWTKILLVRGKLWKYSNSGSNNRRCVCNFLRQFNCLNKLRPSGLW